MTQGSILRRVSSVAMKVMNPGNTAVSITHDGHEAILKEVVGPGLIAVNTCVDMMCVSIIRATTGALPIVGDESQHGRQRHPQE